MGTHSTDEDKHHKKLKKRKDREKRESPKVIVRIELGIGKERKIGSEKKRSIVKRKENVKGKGKRRRRRKGRNLKIGKRKEGKTAVILKIVMTLVKMKIKSSAYLMSQSLMRTTLFTFLCMTRSKQDGHV